MHFSMHYFKTQVLNLTNALFQLRYDARRCFVSDANFAFQLCLFFRFILLLSLSKIIEGKNGLKWPLPQQAGGRINKKKFFLKNVGIFGCIRSLGTQNRKNWPPFRHPPKAKNFEKPPPKSKKSKPFRFSIFLFNKIAWKLNFDRNRHLKTDFRPTGSGARPVFVSRQVFRHHRR